MDQEILERDGTGYRCRRCGITVMGEVPAEEHERLCTWCRSVRELRQHWGARERR
jgi:DNA-directed RNA polymerase subunit RPC12/RpoP